MRVFCSATLLASLAHPAHALAVPHAQPATRLRAPSPVMAELDKATEIHPHDWLKDTNRDKVGEIAAVARKYSPAKESEFERVEKVEVVSYDENGFEIEEVLCSTIDNNCIAITVPVAWPNDRVHASAHEMAEAFATLAKAAKPTSAADAYDNAPKRELFEEQDRRLRGLRDMLNSRFEPHLRLMALTHAREVISSTEELEKAEMTQICFEGFTLQLVSSDLSAWSAQAEKERQGTVEPLGLRKTSEISMIFDPPCTSEEEVEDRIVELTMQAES